MGRIQRALISVSDKNGIVEFSRALTELDIEIISTGGTASLLRDNKIPVKDVSELTGFPEMMDGRVKTLHPKIHGGILALRDNPAHVAKMQEHGIAPIDLVVVNLYPFEATVARGAAFDEVVENIDIGGPTMVRAAAKNHRHVGVVVDPKDYDRDHCRIEGKSLLFIGRHALSTFPQGVPAHRALRWRDFKLFFVFRRNRAARALGRNGQRSSDKTPGHALW